MLTLLNKLGLWTIAWLIICYSQVSYLYPIKYWWVSKQIILCSKDNGIYFYLYSFKFIYWCRIVLLLYTISLSYTKLLIYNIMFNLEFTFTLNILIHLKCISLGFRLSYSCWALFLILAFPSNLFHLGIKMIHLRLGRNCKWLSFRQMVR